MTTPTRVIADSPTDPTEAVVVSEANVEKYWDRVGETPDITLLGSDEITCNDKDFPSETMLFCPVSGTLYYVKSDVAKVLSEDNGSLAIELTVAHEFGHAIQAHHHRLQEPSEHRAAELSADCLAGMYAASLDKPQSEIDAAWRAAPVGHEADRMQAFTAGQHNPLSARNLCITKYGD